MCKWWGEKIAAKNDKKSKHFGSTISKINLVGSRTLKYPLQEGQRESRDC
jgi:hypothetical protein